MNNRIPVISLLIFFFCAFFSLSVKAEQKRTYTIGIVPQFEIRHLRKIWNPILKEIEKNTGYNIKLIGSPTIQDFSTEVKQGRFDFAYMNPLQTVLSHKSQGYIPLIRDRGRKLQGILVVRNDSEIKSVKELNGKKVAFPSPNALGATLLLLENLNTEHNIKIKPVYVKTHSSVYLNVIVKQVTAGGGVQKTLNQQKQNISGLLRVLHRSPKVAPHSLSAHPRVPKQVRDIIKRTLLKLGESDVGKALLAKIPIKKIGKTSIREYEQIKRMKLERFYAN